MGRNQMYLVFGIYVFLYYFDRKYHVIRRYLIINSHKKIWFLFTMLLYL